MTEEIITRDSAAFKELRRDMAAAILRRIDAALDEARRGGADLAFVDGAVIVGTPFEARCDALILVTAPYETSVARICARDGIAPEMARRRLDAQTPLETLRAARPTISISSDFIVGFPGETDADFEEKPYILKITPDESPINIKSLIDFYHQVDLSPQQIRDSIKHLSWSCQLKKVINSL